jgi:alkylation response protein AidB-like acyl-CoA dehydrogenase
MGRGSDYVARARELAPLLAAAASRNERERRLCDEVVAALHEARLFRLLLPRDLGGGEVAPETFIEVLEEVARADASPAWILCQTDVCSIAAVYLAPAVAREIFGPERAVLAWGSTPMPRAVKVAGGYRVTGTWEFGSGCRHASWLGGHCPVFDEAGATLYEPDGTPGERTVLFPTTVARLIDVWHVVGLRGTASDSYAVEDLFVPDDRAITSMYRWPDLQRQKLSLAYRFGSTALYAPGAAAVALGNARGLYEAFVDLACRKRARGAETPLSADPLVQAAVATAEARLGAAHAYLLQSVRAAQSSAMREGAIALAKRMTLRAASTFAISEATAVADDLYHLAGSTAIFEEEPFERRLRDAHTLAQHLQGRPGHFATVGRWHFGLDCDLRFV